MSLLLEVPTTDSGPYTLVSRGMHLARIIGVADLGHHMNYEQTKQQHMVGIAYEVVDQKGESGQPLMVTQTCTFSLHEMATLHNVVAAARSGNAPDKGETVDLRELLGCRLARQKRPPGTSIQILPVTMTLTVCLHCSSTWSKNASNLQRLP